MWIGDAWQEIDLDALRHNAAIARSLAGSAKVIAVVKADAYGHGAIRCAQALIEAGADMLAVSCLREALALRKAIGGIPILVMGATATEGLALAIEKGITLTLTSLSQAEALSAAARLKERTARAHVKLDTGFHRLGLSAAEALADIPKMAQLPNLILEGLFTHLALIDQNHDEAQMAGFMRVANTLKAQGIAPMLHVADSIALVRYPAWRLDAVRVGALLYGAQPADNAAQNLRCVMRVCARIVQMRDIPAGDSVGYLPFVAKRPSRIATLPIGYADGLPRSLASKGQAALHGRRVPYAGLPCMDQLMLDVTDMPEARPGDVVTLFGGEGKDAIGLTEFASWVASNRNEPLCHMGRRTPRVYKARGQTLAVEDPLI